MQHEFLRALNAKLSPALGCTEPVSVALAAAHCRRLMTGVIRSIAVEVSPLLFKNAMGVYVPGTGQKGLKVAAAAGWIAGDSRLGLEVLSPFSNDDMHPLQAMLDANRISLSYHDTGNVLYCRVLATTESQTCEVIIGGSHTHIVQVKLDNHIIEHNAWQPPHAEQAETSAWSLNHILDFIESAPLADLSVVDDAERLNVKLSEEGLTRRYGAAVGQTLRSQQMQGLVGTDLVSQIMLRSAAASDARMGGAPYAAMSNSGSGNQGIAATLPVVVTADWINAKPAKRTRALALSHLVAIYSKQQQPVLSALCAASTAAMGASAAITWLLGGDEKQIHAALCNMTSDVSGILCDGANVGCAMKVSTSVSSAAKSALLALAERSLAGEGIAAQDADASIANLGRLSQGALKEADPIIISML